MVLNSAQNVDRVVTAYRAALRCGRQVVLDLYTASVMAATGRDSIPQLGDDWPNVHVFVPRLQRLKVLHAQEFERTERVRPQRLFPENLLADPGKYLLVGAYHSELASLIRGGQLADRVVVYSMWNGYLSEPSGVRLRATLDSARIPLIEHHTSGHANTTDLARLVTAVHPWPWSPSTRRTRTRPETKINCLTRDIELGDKAGSDQALRPSNQGRASRT